MNPHDREQLKTRINQVLDQPLDEATRRRLAGMRARVLQQADRPDRRSRLVPALVLGACAAIAFTALVKQPWNTLSPPTSVTAFEIISSEDELEMFEELEFYAWLAQQEDAG